MQVLSRNGELLRRGERQKEKDNSIGFWYHQTRTVYGTDRA